MARHRLTIRAKADYKDIGAYIAQFNHSASKRTVKELRRVCREVIASSPNIGTMCPEIGAGVRCFSVGNYIIVFRGSNPVEICEFFTEQLTGRIHQLFDIIFSAVNSCCG